ncbi:MAG: tetratricopeptide repeat protein [Gemmatimonadota bacterium]
MPALPRLNLSRRSHLLGLLFAILALAYADSFGNGFHYDDSHSLVDNPHLRRLANVPRFFADPGTFSAMPDTRMYRPLLLVTYALNYALDGYQVRGYHAANLLLHLANALLVWEVARQLAGSGPRVVAAAAAAAVAFALHPLASEPVNYISSRSALLATTFYLAAFLVLVRTPSDRPGPWRHLALAALFAGGLLSKENTITFPAVGAAYLLLSGRWRAASLLAVPAALGLAYVAGTRAIIGKAVLDPVRPLAIQWATQVKALPFYLARVAMPVELSAEPAFAAAAGLTDGPVLLAAAFGLSLAVAVGLGRRRWSAEVFAALWFALALLPESLVPLNVLVNEHRLYLPMAGAAVGLGALWARMAAGRRAVGLAVAAIAMVLVAQRNRAWQSEETLWADAAAKGPGMARPHVNLGKAYLEEGRYDEAIAASRRALAIQPDLDRAHYNIGTAYLSQRHYAEAMASYERALEINPRLLEAVNNLANAYQEQGRYAEALPLYRRALALADHGAIHHNMGSTFLAMGEHDSSVAHFSRALQADDASRASYEGLARAYRAGDRLESAVQVLNRALAHWPADPALVQLLGDTEAARGREAEALAAYRRAGSSDVDARLRLGAQLRQRREWERARRQYETALAREPDNARAHNALGEVLQADGDVQGALAAYRRAAELDPSLAEAYANIGLVNLSHGRPVEAVAALERAADLDPGSDLTWGLLGRARAQAGQRDGARRAYERAIELAPGNADFRYELAVLYQEAGTAAAAEAMYRAALERSPGMARAHYGLGVALVEQRRYREGAEAMEAALDQGFDRPEAYVNLATARLNLGQGAEAARAYESFLNRYAEDDSLRRQVLEQLAALRARTPDRDGPAPR